MNEGLSCFVWSGLFGENKLLLNRFATRNLKIDAMFEAVLKSLISEDLGFRLTRLPGTT